MRSDNRIKKSTYRATLTAAFTPFPRVFVKFAKLVSDQTMTSPSDVTVTASVLLGMKHEWVYVTPDFLKSLQI
jgi:hypothetical protein